MKPDHGSGDDMEKNRDFAERLIHDFNQHDINLFAKWVHKDAEVRDLNTNTLTLKGIDQVVDYYQRAFRKDIGTNTIVDMMSEGNTIVMKEHVDLPDGGTEDYFNMMEFEGDMIKRIWFKTL